MEVTQFSQLKSYVKGIITANAPDQHIWVSAGPGQVLQIWVQNRNSDGHDMLRFETLPVQNQHWQVLSKKNHRKCSNIKLQASVHWLPILAECNIDGVNVLMLLKQVINFRKWHMRTCN